MGRLARITGTLACALAMGCGADAGSGGLLEEGGEPTEPASPTPGAATELPGSTLDAGVATPPATGEGNAMAPTDPAVPTDPTVPTDPAVPSPGDTTAPTPPTATGATPDDLPTTTAACPDLNEGIRSFAGVDVNLIATGPSGTPGPIILYWHGTGSNPSFEVPAGVGQAGLQAIRSGGGIVAGFISGQTSGTNSSGNDVWNTGDMAIADEVIACAIEAGMADTSHIHSLGMSAGGLMTTNFSYQRSNYLASVVTYSGGHIVFNGFDTTSTTKRNSSNQFAALIFHGGTSDVVTIPFKDGSEAYRDHLRSQGHLAVVCDHGDGHTIPGDAVPSVWQFFMDHPYQQDPSPYAGGLPASFPSYCESP